MASDVTTIEPAVPAPPRPHRERFLLVYGLLGGVLAAAIIGIVVFAGRSIDPGAAWSGWRPSGGGEGAAKQIAGHLAKGYRLPNGAQLVDVITNAPSVTGPSNKAVPIHYVAVRGGKGSADHLDVISSSNSVMYTLCGLGTACSIASGKPTLERGALVRREILELALYTFKYAGGIKSVIALMPPVAGQPPHLVYLQRSDVAPELKEPLAKTLGPKVPLPSTIPPREVHAVDGLTVTRVYKYTFAAAPPTGEPVLVLTPA